MAAFAYLLIAIFIVAERRLRRGTAARSLAATPADRGTTRLIGVAFGFALTGGVLVLLSRRGDDPGQQASRCLGLAAMLAGLLLRIWAARTLGQYYTRTLTVVPDQTVVHVGPYCLIRHPGYLADLVLWIGFGLAHGSRLLTGAIAVMMLAVYGRRITAEEALLRADLGDAYRAYSRDTWRLVPLIF